ncbi:hypothetical protein ONS95_013519 [Cadophora gregata]|uniref:uncharacterized protein n=1 Tax=Cadophora gregata TaxID=51156 RepID=UPI0026DB7797|nr:uncharacterized protein ONS95_013519 [Cadophora gregata]KAK0099583.1 hypothetical protein ONS96_008085 [Cadophora gregata f. sp. sojae]KAK0116507.1 hypothetical protein ONS95_013519 [Cadophora gregata]
MAVNPNTTSSDIPKRRYHPNPFLTSSPSSPVPNAPQPLKRALLPSYLLASLTHILTNCPPTLPWLSPFRAGIPSQTYKGLFSGPTSIAYLFYSLSLSTTPTTRTLQIHNKTLLQWSKAYLSLGQDTVPRMLSQNCGISNEYLAFHTLSACIYRDETHAMKVLNALGNLNKDKETTPATYCELLKGRAGGLYILRLLKRGMPHLTEEIDILSEKLTDEILGQYPWTWDGRRYLGAVHGEIGILTQIVLSSPSRSRARAQSESHPFLEKILLEILDLQGEDGNWPVVPGKDLGLVQFCHGAAGVVISLLAMKRSFFF